MHRAVGGDGATWNKRGGKSLTWRGGSWWREPERRALRGRKLTTPFDCNACQWRRAVTVAAEAVGPWYPTNGSH